MPALTWVLLARDQASRTVNKFGKNVEGTSSSAAKSIGKIALAFDAVAAISVAASVKMASDFQSSMLKIQTQAGASSKDVKTLSKDVLGLGGKVQQTPMELSKSLYHLKSVGMDNANAMKALKSASDLAAVGGSNLDETTTALAGAWRSGIKGAGNFQTAVATMNAIVGAGNMHMEDLVGAMGTGFLASARSFGLSLSSVGSALALMTDEGIPAQVAATRLRTSFTLLTAPSQKAEGLLEDIGLTGLKMANAMRSPGGLVAAIGLLKQHLDASGKSASEQAMFLSQAFGGARTGSSILTLLNNYTVLQKKQDQINHTLGKFGDAVKEQKKTVAAQMGYIKSSFDTVAIEVGTVALPAVAKFAGFLGHNLLPGAISIGNKLGSAIFPSGGISHAIGKVQTEINNFVQGFKSTKPKPIKASDYVAPHQMMRMPTDIVQTKAPKDKAGQFGKQIGEAINSGLGGINWGKLGQGLGKGLMTAIQYLATQAGKLSKMIITTLSNLDWESIGASVGGNAVGFAIGFIANLGKDLFSPSFWEKHWWDTIIAVLSVFGVGKLLGPLARIFESIKFLNVLAPMLRGLEGLASPLTKVGDSVIKAFGKGLLDGFTKVFPEAGAFLERELPLITTRIGVWAMDGERGGLSFMRSIANGILKGITFVGSVIGKIVFFILKPFVGIAGWLLGKGRDLVSGLLNGILEIARPIAGWIGDHVIKPVLDRFNGIIGWLVQKGMNLITGLKNGILAIARTVGTWIYSNAIKPILDRFVGALGWLWQHGHDLIQGLLNGIWAIARTIGSWVWSHVVTPITSKFVGGATWLFSHGQDLINGLKNGVVSSMRNIGGWVKSAIVDPIVNWLKKHFKIGSPSKLIADEVGVHLTSGLFQGAASWDLGGLVKDAFGSLPAALGSFIENGVIDISKLPAKALSALVGVGSKVGGFFSSLFGGSSGGGAVDRWKSVVDMALALNGLPQSLESQVLHQISTESGGNPLAQNNSDSNAAAGDPSRGLLQTIMSTFMAYHVNGTSMNIFDPLANVAAAIRYAVARYGPTLMSGGAGLGSGHGYANGGIIAEKIVGVGTKSGKRYEFGEKEHEYVLNQSQMTTLRRHFAKHTMTTNDKVLWHMLHLSELQKEGKTKQVAAILAADAKAAKKKPLTVADWNPHWNVSKAGFLMKQNVTGIKTKPKAQIQNVTEPWIAAAKARQAHLAHAAHIAHLKHLGLPLPAAKASAKQLHLAHEAHLKHLQHLKKGYATGTARASQGWHLIGENGPEAMYFGGGEKVVPNSKIRSGGGGGSVTYQINVSPTPLARPADIGREVVSAIKDYEKGSGKSWRN